MRNPASGSAIALNTPTNRSATRLMAASMNPIAPAATPSEMATPRPIAANIPGLRTIAIIIAAASVTNAIAGIAGVASRDNQVTLGESIKSAANASAPALPINGRIANAAATSSSPHAAITILAVASDGPMLPMVQACARSIQPGGGWLGIVPRYV